MMTLKGSFPQIREALSHSDSNKLTTLMDSLSKENEANISELVHNKKNLHQFEKVLQYGLSKSKPKLVVSCCKLLKRLPMNFQILKSCSLLKIIKTYKNKPTTPQNLRIQLNTVFEEWKRSAKKSTTPTSSLKKTDEKRSISTEETKNNLLDGSVTKNIDINKNDISKQDTDGVHVSDMKTQEQQKDSSQGHQTSNDLNNNQKQQNIENKEEMKGNNKPTINQSNQKHENESAPSSHQPSDVPIRNDTLHKKRPFPNDNTSKLLSTTLKPPIKRLKKRKSIKWAKSLEAVRVYEVIRNPLRILQEDWYTPPLLSLDPEPKDINTDQSRMLSSQWAKKPMSTVRRHTPAEPIYQEPPYNERDVPVYFPSQKASASSVPLPSAPSTSSSTPQHVATYPNYYTQPSVNGQMVSSVPQSYFQQFQSNQQHYGYNYNYNQQQQQQQQMMMTHQHPYGHAPSGNPYGYSNPSHMQNVSNMQYPYPSQPPSYGHQSQPPQQSNYYSSSSQNPYA